MFNKLMNKAIIKGLVIKGNMDLKAMDKMAKNAKAINEKLLMDIVRKNKDTEYGRRYDFANIHSIDDYRKKVPFSDYDNYAPYIERMTQKGEKNLLTADPVVQYAMTSGSIGAPKYIPVTQAGIDIYMKYSVTRMLALADQWCVKNRGHHLYAARGLNTMEVIDTYMKDGTPCGNISGSASKSMKGLFKYFMTSPIPVLFPENNMDMKYCKVRYALQEEDMLYFFSTFMSHVSDLLMYIQDNWELLCDDIEKGTINEDIKMDEEARVELLKYTTPDPKRAEKLRVEFRKGFDKTIISRIWSNLSLIGAIGTGGFASYTHRVEKMSEGIPFEYSIYAASEGLMASARNIQVPEFNLLADSCFFEFLPADAKEDETETLTLDQLEVGKEYEIILTTTSGFYRYRIFDVIRVLGYQDQCPRITFAYRKKQMLNLVGEKTTEEQINAAIEAFSEEVGVSIPDYTVYADDDVNPGRYVFIIEPDGALDSGKCEEYARMIDKALSIKSYEYEDVLKIGEIQGCKVFLQQRQTHQLWRDLRIMKGASSNQVKPVRLLDSPVKKKFFQKLIEE